MSNNDPVIKRQLCRSAFVFVMETYYDAREAIGSAGAIDYSQMQGGSGPQYSDHEKGVMVTNYVQDVVNVARHSLTPAEFALFKATYLDQVDPLNEVHSVQLLQLQTTLGSLFRKHNLYPVQKYFQP